MLVTDRPLRRPPKISLLSRRARVIFWYRRCRLARNTHSSHSQHQPRTGPSLPRSFSFFFSFLSYTLFISLPLGSHSSFDIDIFVGPSPRVARPRCAAYGEPCVHACLTNVHGALPDLLARSSGRALPEAQSTREIPRESSFYVKRCRLHSFNIDPPIHRPGARA